MGETVQKDLDKANSAWHELAVTFGGPCRRTMICRMLRYRVVTATLFYYSRNIASTSIRTLQFRPRELNSSDVAEITLMSPGDILVLYTDGVYDGSDEEEREQLEMILREHDMQGARDICNALLDYSVEQDEHLRQIGDGSLIDDKTVFIIKRLETSSS